jgi:hypothetical protein
MQAVEVQHGGFSFAIRADLACQLLVWLKTSSGRNSVMHLPKVA